MSTRWTTVAAVVLGATTMMAGCGQRSGVRATAQADAPVATAPAAVTPVTSASAAAACPTQAPPTPVGAMEPVKPEPRKAALGGDERLTIRRLTLAHGVRNREPVDPGGAFKVGSGKIYAFVEIDNRGRAPGEIVVEFEPPGGGAPHGDVTLAVGPAARWRTWAYTRTAQTPGSWTALVKNHKGDVLARAPFEVTL